MRSFHRTFSAALLLAVGLVASRASGQGGVSGSIVGSVYDQTGQPVRGVKITARSDTQIGGPKVAYTNDEGNFRIVGLLPGTFEISSAAPKLKTVIQKDVKVGINSAVEVNLVMEVETQVEEVKIVEKAPVVSTTSASIKEVYDEEFLDNLPMEFRTAAEAFVSGTTPGVNAIDDRTFRVRGGSQSQNLVGVEGFTMNGQKVTVKSLAAIEVQTAGYGAENANVPGGVVNMVSKSGSNKFELDLSGFAEDSHMRFFTDGSDAGTHNWNYLINPSISGPIIKDRLWYYLNTESRLQGSTPSDPTGSNLLGPPPDRWYLNSRTSLKLTWQATTRNKISTYSNVSRTWQRDYANPFQNERDAQQMRDQFDYFHGVIWEALLSDRLFFRSQVGYQQFWDTTAPERCLSEPVDCDHVQQIRNSYPTTLRLQNLDTHTQTVTRTLEVINQLEWFLSTRGFGEHDIKVRSRFFGQFYENAQSTPGDGYTQFRGTDPELQRTYYANDPRNEPARFGWRVRGTSGLTTVHSLSDSIRMGRYLTLSPGFAYTTSSASNDGDAGSLKSGALTPHLSVAWDATHDGRTVLRASYNNYVDTDALRLSRFVLGDRVYQECKWNASTGQFDSGCRYGGGSSGRTIGLPCGPNGLNPDGTSCKEKLRIPRTFEYTAGAEREVTQGVAIGADLVYRLYTYPYEDRETNRVWQPSGYGLDPSAAYRSGRNEVVNDLGTPSDARRRYLGVTASIHKREGKLKISGGYTWSMLTGNVFDQEANEYGLISVRDRYYLDGYLPDDARHTFRVSMTYPFLKWLSVGLVYRYTSGRPYQRRFYNDVIGDYVDYRASVGVNPGSNVNDAADDRELRLPDIQQVNLQLRGNLRPLFGINLEAYVDVLNALALRTTTSVRTEDGPLWSTPVDRLDPFRMRLGFRYRY